MMNTPYSVCTKCVIRKDCIDENGVANYMLRDRECFVEVDQEEDDGHDPLWDVLDPSDLLSGEEEWVEEDEYMPPPHLPPFDDEEDPFRS